MTANKREDVNKKRDGMSTWPSYTCCSRIVCCIDITLAAIAKFRIDIDCLSSSSFETAGKTKHKF